MRRIHCVAHERRADTPAALRALDVHTREPRCQVESRLHVVLDREKQRRQFYRDYESGQ